MLGLRIIKRILSITNPNARIENSDEMKALTVALNNLRDELHIAKQKVYERRRMMSCEHVPENRRNGGQRVIVSGP